MGKFIKRLFLLMVGVLIGMGMELNAQAPAFPGAEGHGRYVTGGRGGEVRHVTNLNNSGTGSFRAAVSGSTPKIVVFDVSGVIALSSELTIGANTTIEGQTAPYPGVTVRYYTVRPKSNTIIRYMRFRRGQERDVNDGADASWQREETGIIFDHCSFSWSIDEVASFYDNNNFTMQWCSLGESLNNAGHGKGAHGYGGIWGGKLASFHHNMIVHVNNRSPRFCGARYDWSGFTNNKEYNQYQWENAVQAENVDMRNCVVYNCGNGCYGGPGGGYINMVNNYYKSGPAGKTTRLTQVSVGSSSNSSDNSKYWTMSSRYYINGNQLDDKENYDWTNVSYDSGVYTINGERCSADANHYYGNGVTYYQNSNGTDCVRIKLDESEAAPTGLVTTHSAQTAFDKVLDHVGASFYRDDVDVRYADETRNGTCTYKGSVTNKWGRIDLVSDVNGYTEANFPSQTVDSDFDSDGDGMADIWEEANGLNPNDASDAKAYTLDSKGWYTNVEVYCNALVEEQVKAQNADAESAVDEYFPTVAKVDGVPYYETTATTVDPSTGPGGGDNVSYTISQGTYISSVSDTEWSFQNGITVSNNNGKTYQAGKENGIKYSAGVTYAIDLPQGVTINEVVLRGYDNYDGTDAYLGDMTGWSGSPACVFPQKDEEGNYIVVENTVAVNNVSGTLQFTPQGKQVVWVITLNGTKVSTGIASATVDSTVESVKFYTVSGVEISRPEQHRGILIRVEQLKNGKTRTTKYVER